MCDKGISRSPTIEGLLKFNGYETLSVGVDTSSPETRAVLSDWCDKAILTSPNQRLSFPDLEDDQILVWPIPDAFPRPFNPELRRLVLSFIKQEGL